MNFYACAEVWQLKKLRAMGINGLSIGTESGDDDVLALAGKGYTAADILEQCKAVQQVKPLFYFGGFPYAVPGHGTVPYGADDGIPKKPESIVIRNQTTSYCPLISQSIFAIICKD